MTKIIKRANPPEVLSWRGGSHIAIERTLYDAVLSAIKVSMGCFQLISKQFKTSSKFQLKDSPFFLKMASKQKTNSGSAKGFSVQTPENVKGDAASPSLSEELADETRKKMNLEGPETKAGAVADDEKYVLYQETSAEENESWYFFIRYKGNEENLEHLARQLNSVEFYIIDELSTFDIDMEHMVSAKTAKEMTKVEINSVRFHSKYDGVLQRIDLDFRSRDSDETKICKANDVLGNGAIEEYLDKEDIDPEDMISDGEDEARSSEESSEESPSPPPRRKNEGRNVPKILQQSNLPRFAQRKRKNNRK